jgi:hypothetical protein
MRQLLSRRHIAPSADPIRRDRYTATSAHQRIVLVPFPVFAILFTEIRDCVRAYQHASSV